MLAGVQAGVEQVPQLRALATWVCHWPKLSRWLKMRSLARAFSSSRRAPPISASKRNSSIASSKVTDWCTLRLSPG
jgi:hypothetical protein